MCRASTNLDGRWSREALHSDCLGKVIFPVFWNTNMQPQSAVCRAGTNLDGRWSRNRPGRRVVPDRAFRPSLMYILSRRLTARETPTSGAPVIWNVGILFVWNLWGWVLWQEGGCRICDEKKVQMSWLRGGCRGWTWWRRTSWSLPWSSWSSRRGRTRRPAMRS